LADYYCIKCGACIEVCPVKAEYVEEPFEFESQGMTLQRKLKRLTNADEMPIKLDRWRVNHTEVSSVDASDNAHNVV